MLHPPNTASVFPLDIFSQFVENKGDYHQKVLEPWRRVVYSKKKHFYKLFCIDGIIVGGFINIVERHFLFVTVLSFDGG